MFLSAVFAPGMAVMRRLRFSIKLAIVSLMVALPLAYLVSQVSNKITDDIGVIRQELDGIVLIQAATGKIRALQTQRAAVTDAKQFAEQSAQVDEQTRQLYTLAKDSTLVFDPDPATYLLIDMLVSHTVPWAEQIARLRASAADESASGGTGARLEAFEHELKLLSYLMGVQKGFGVNLPSADAALAASAVMATAVRQRLAPGASTGAAQAAAIATASAQALSAVAAYQTTLQDEIAGLLQQRLAQSNQQFWTILLLSGGGIVLVFYALVAFNLSFQHDLEEMQAFMRETAAGDLSYQVQLNGRDELSALASSLHTMVHNLSAMVAAIRSNSALVSHDGASLVQGNQALSDRTEQQAANLEQTAASVQELSATVQLNADAAQHADQAARSVRSMADQGVGLMQEAIGSIEAIQASTHRMDEIVSVIDGLAFQTNILALNAAVEAARAGESGRGFAVVASEVRALAQRSAESAKEIRKLIGESTTRVATGVTQIRSAGENIQKITQGIRGVADDMAQISVSSAEQSASLSEITTAVRQLDEITQQNAALVERSVSQATALELRASTLIEGVSGFTLLQGSADEAKTLVERALSLRRQCAGKDAYARALTDRNAGFFDRDMYVFLLDTSGRYLAFGGNEAKVGTRVQDIPGVDGQALLTSIMDQADHAPGWVEYDIANPSTGRVQPKMSYVQRVDDLYLGCGVYKNLVAS